MEILIDLSILVFSLAIGFALLVMIAIGCLLIPVSAIAGFALLVLAASEILSARWKSGLIMFTGGVFACLTTAVAKSATIAIVTTVVNSPIAN